ncbi:heterogeneous nuclear ribonucleoprotein K homolog isoform X1 [Euwallacea similis]|uniref:heterogeneous nuclear ribonucleoprotein K homolog isoform X1 n=2 Tax=Euwallacea similis TaxID=1736056 RepID=UPI00345086FE
MKRGADGDMGGPQKRSKRAGDEEVRLLIPSKVAGSIIGKAGQNITKLRGKYKASITVPDCPGPERLLSLSSDMDSVCNIVNDVMPNLEENGATVGNDIDMRMMVHQSQAGCIIGKGGCKIKEIREKIGTRIKIFSNPAPQSTDRVIQIIGDAAKCIDTLREVLTLIKQSPIKGAVNPYDPHNYDEFYANEYGGWGGQQQGGGGGGGGGRDRDGSNFGGNRGGPPSGGPRGGPPRSGPRDGPRGGPGPRDGPRGGPGAPRSGPGLRDSPFGGGNKGGVGSRFGGDSGPSAPPSLRAGGGGGGFGNRSGPGNRDTSFGNRNSFGDRNNFGSGGGGGSGSGNHGGGGPFGTGRQNNGSSFDRNGWGGSGGPFSQPPPSYNGSPPNASSGPIGLGGATGPGGLTSTQVTIPTDLAGAIIGKGGGRIRKIRNDSGAGITIDEPLPGSNDRIITISGTANQIQMAQYLLQQSVHQNTESRNNF